MTWTLTSDVSAYAEAAEPWLLRDPVRNTVLLTVLRWIRSGQYSDPLLGWYVEHGEVRGALCHTPPYPLLLGASPFAELPALVGQLVNRGRELPGVTGPVETVSTFSSAWWQQEKERRSERLYRLSTLVAPMGPGGQSALYGPGRARLATPEDLGAAVHWFRMFQHEAHVDAAADPGPVVSARLNRKELVWWELAGQPVSLAGVSVPISGMSRIGPVYTPPEFRRHGYGSAVTYAATRKAIDDGATEILLFTDLSNPISNSIYQAIGYVPVADYATISFS
ncbi:putative acetyltransferase [Acrocarpospora phusangensis]|uniref:Acetyltransferase n=1 Tax=Acrocarpospora phusangensis TaxID=1070424 RepID=A0A919QEL5_9ACTN|nr:GNAT family N-acetyltransferase [Acrocarpospora phusangensis]GIH27431.1 putative acetyltransferase [Acrocarpospora phusangensis]